MKKLILKNGGRGWDVHRKKVVLYCYVEKNGGVFRNNGVCVGNHKAGDFLLTVPKKTSDG